jgi:asparagine synthase (glutamine-hydrolysing)
MTSWGHDPALPTTDRPVLLSGPARRTGALVDTAQVARWIREGDLDRLTGLLPPFGAVGLSPEGLRVVIDGMGFRQAFRLHGPEWAAVSTSARLLAACSSRGIDVDAALLQSQLGWQLGERTLFSGVTKLAPGESVLLSRSGLSVDVVGGEPPHPGSIGLEDALERASALLLRSMTHYLGDVEDPLLQLTGGMDSRIVLSAITPNRRRGLRAMTLDVPGSSDAAVAGMIARHCALEHRLVSLDGLADVSPQEWFERVRTTAEAHDGMISPIAKAATDWAEERVDQGERLSGMGGEIARGFYYTGVVRPAPVTRARSERLARWRMLVNEAVEPDCLAPRYRRDARSVALDLIHATLAAADEEWFTATDDLYYRHRMTRWAGLSESVASASRPLTNPMLDPGFIDIARNLSPWVKQHARFLAALQMRLDPVLGRLPLEGRPSPAAYATPGISARTRHGVTRTRLAVRKVHQRLRRAGRPPAGSHLVAAAVMDHLRAHPALLDPLRDSAWFDEQWVGAVLGGTLEPHPGTVAFMMNMLVALDEKE